MKKNLVANYAGTGTVTLLQLAAAPVYAAFLGAEAYGLIGLQLTLTMLASLVDLGLTPALSRELARLSALPGGGPAMRGLVRNLQGLCLALSLVVVLLLLAAAPYLAGSWVRPERLGEAEVRMALQLMAVQIGAQLPLGFYSGGLVGLQRHVVLNVANVAGTLLRTGGAVLVLWLFTPSLASFFAWHALATAAHLALMLVLLWRALPAGGQAVDAGHLRAVRRYALGMAGVVVLSLLLTQLDKIILSRTLGLADFGHYMLAVTLAMTLGKPVGPLFTTLMPRMTQLFAQGDHRQLAGVYRQGSQLASLLVLPVSGILVVFPFESILLWTLSRDVAQAVSPMLAPLTLGFACNALMYLPYALTLSTGWVRFVIVQNLIACAVMIPLTIVLSLQHGAIGGAWSWALLNLGYVLFSVFFLHRRHLPGECRIWYLGNLLPALAAVAVPLAVVRRVAAPEGPAEIAVTLGLLLILSALSAALALPLVRRRFLARFHPHA